jgi:uncharacterized membrane protein
MQLDGLQLVAYTIEKFFPNKTETIVEQVLLIVLASAGFLISLYFTGVYYGYLKSDVWWIPVFCRMEHDSCASIVQTPEARIFGVPNFVLGLVFYSVLVVTILGDIGGFLFDLLTATALLTVVLAVYLIYALRIRLKTDCVLCYSAHGINILIAMILIALKYEIV